MEDTTKPIVVKRDYKLTGNYGTYVIEKVVTVVGSSDWEEWDWDDEAWSHTGIMFSLKDWTFIEEPNGEDWEVERVLSTPRD